MSTNGLQHETPINIEFNLKKQPFVNDNQVDNSKKIIKMKKIKVKNTIFFWLSSFLVDKIAETSMNRAFEHDNQMTTNDNQRLTNYK